MNIYFTAAVSGGRAHQPEYAHIVKVLEQRGVVYSAHIQDDSLSQYGETEERPVDILSRELNALEHADVVVAEATTPSLGVGYLISRATSLKKRVIVLYFGEDTLKLSAIIKGNTQVEVRTYKTNEDIESVIAAILD